jgi:CRISPR-associated protein Csh2
MNNLKQRSELLFLYDATYCNPNGDPLDSNRPRIDEETGRCLVTDVRLKRTIRDYLIEKGFNGKTDKFKDVFVRDEDGKAITGAKRAEAYKDKGEYLQKFIDVRLFGGVSAPKKATKTAKSSKEDAEEGDETTDTKNTFHYTGPVQFGMGKTLHPVRVNYIKGTGAFATSEANDTRTFREEYNITYGLIGFHGVVNEKAAAHTRTSQEDINELLEAIWNGTKGLLTRSKKGHMPRLLIKIDYREDTGGFFIGDLVERLKIKYLDGKSEESLADVSDLILDISALNAEIKKNTGKIASVKVLNHDERLSLSEPVHQI